MNKYSVSEFTKTVKNLLESSFPAVIAVSGEISGLSKSPSGHYYFNLKDSDASVKSVYFSSFAKIPNAFIPKNGDKVMVIAEVRLYAPDGAYQLMVKKVVYDTVGDFWKKFEQTKLKLEQEGLFRQETKKAIPNYPKRVAILTSPTGAAIHDFIVTSYKNGKYYDIDVWGIPVQGIDAAKDIVSALNTAGKRTDIYDALVLARGGGSSEDLAVFSEESVVRALKNCDVPTIAAIGHENDVSISDFAADMRVATPTAAAELLSKYHSIALKQITQNRHRLEMYMNWQLENTVQKFDKLFIKLSGKNPKNELINTTIFVDSLYRRLFSALESYSQLRHSAVNQAVASIERNNIKLIFEKKQNELNILVNKMMQSMKNRTVENSHKIEMLTQRLTLTDPERVLGLGYALILKDNIPVTDIKSLHVEEELEIKMKGGYIDAFVTGRKINMEEVNGENPDNS